MTDFAAPQVGAHMQRTPSVEQREQRAVCPCKVDRRTHHELLGERLGYRFYRVLGGTVHARQRSDVVSAQAAHVEHVAGAAGPHTGQHRAHGMALALCAWAPCFCVRERGSYVSHSRALAIKGRRAPFWKAYEHGGPILGTCFDLYRATVKHCNLPNEC